MYDRISNRPVNIRCSGTEEQKPPKEPVLTAKQKKALKRQEKKEKQLTSKKSARQKKKALVSFLRACPSKERGISSIADCQSS